MARVSRSDWALLFHLVGAFALVAGMAVAAAAHATALKREWPRTTGRPGW
jgi:hypothetical protein